ncbi:MAG: SGNH/GDSL hydrolase family protein [Longimicrobiales bacterium]|nr:SGNH/GDSL hydrolase family protein [Longimicrobiales bacterium]
MTSDTVSFLALGDSYTIGESVDSALRWPVQLAKAISGEGIPVREPVIIARTGWTTDELAGGIENAGITGAFDLVTLLIGVNNQYRGRDLEEYRVQFLDLLARAIGFSGGIPGNVVVLSIPDWGVTPFAEGRNRGQIGEEIDAFNSVKREESEAAGVRYVDVTGISRRAITDPSLVAADGLHPSGAMYALWAEAALPVALEILRPDATGQGTR